MFTENTGGGHSALAPFRTHRNPVDPGAAGEAQLPDPHTNGDNPFPFMGLLHNSLYAGGRGSYC
jgi:hypothetical protein